MPLCHRRSFKLSPFLLIGTQRSLVAILVTDHASKTTALMETILEYPASAADTNMSPSSIEFFRAPTTQKSFWRRFHQESRRCIGQPVRRPVTCPRKLVYRKQIQRTL
ncbi:hypothetical protein F5J12DRAFT_256574 [Pisolithus orientalis]|uniref:uncharacterized protein n=1 Tax=Pisolithus orientalis TaxID=936130 RepID=UPI002224A74A|nr:uncharacterized protein F5J12DRAFT_256574 [Pisolithus orientalis]KAI6000344.1 hypothetical protein F5J12DRAFT_256574 [Pisolithus orientalis]